MTTQNRSAVTVKPKNVARTATLTVAETAPTIITHKYAVAIKQSRGNHSHSIAVVIKPTIGPHKSAAVERSVQEALAIGLTAVVTKPMSGTNRFAVPAKSSLDLVLINLAVVINLTTIINKSAAKANSITVQPVTGISAAVAKTHTIMLPNLAVIPLVLLLIVTTAMATINTAVVLKLILTAHKFAVVIY